MGTNRNTGVPSEHQELRCHAGDRAVAQAPQRLWSLLLRDLKGSPSLGHPALDVPAQAEAGPGGHRGPCQSQPVCDSVR